MGKRIVMKSSFSPAQRIGMSLICGAALSVFVRTESLLTTGQQRSALTIYSAQRLLDGGRIYLDTFYDRLPGAVYFNAIALSIWNSLASVMIFELSCIALASLILYYALRRLTIPAPSAGVTSGWFGMAALALSSLGGANEPAEWALPFIAAFVFFSAAPDAKRPRPAHIFLSGLAAGAAVCFLGREAFLFVIGMLVIRQRRAVFALGFILAPAALAANLYFSGALPSFMESTLSFGFAFQEKDGYPHYFIYIMFVTLVPLILLLAPRQRSKDNKNSGRKSLKTALLVWAAFEVAALFNNGFISATSILTTLVPLTILWSLKTDNVFTDPKPVFKIRTVYILMQASLCGIIFLALTPETNFELNGGQKLRDAAVIAKIVEKNSAPGDRIMVWSDSSLIYVLAGRKAAVYYPAIDPLFSRNLGRRAAPRYISDLRGNPPALIVVQASLLPEGLNELYSDRGLYDIGPSQSPLFDYVHMKLKNSYKLLTVENGIVLLRRLKKI
ncbi:MAG: hypothetical protein WCX65_09625 [bacterium]